MAGLKLMTTGGYVPRVAPHLLADNEGQKAINTKLYAGTLRSWNKSAPITPTVSVSSLVRTIYKGKKANGDDLWLAWNTDVNVVTSPIESTDPMYIYYTGDGVPKKTYSTLAGTTSGGNPAAWYKMGVPAPTTKPTVTRVGTGASPETRVYVYTYVNDFGGIEEESAPSPVSDEVLCGTGDTVTVNGFATVPTSNLNITKRRIYRSVSGSGSTQFQFVTELPIATTSFSDNVASAGLGEVLATLAWEEPPTDLAGLVALPNGFLAGFSGESVYFSEVNAPHAWPSAYAISTGQEIVGLGVFGQSLVVMTKGFPYIMSGVSPESMSAEKVSILEPCIAARSIVQDGFGVTYASPNGLVSIGPGMQGLTTKNIMLRDDFSKFSPTTIRAAFFDGKYFGFYTSGTAEVQNGAFILDQTMQATPLSLTTLTSDACYVDKETANMYVVQDSKICQWESDSVNRLPYEWKSKRFVFNAPSSLAAIEVDADFAAQYDAAALQAQIAAIIASNQAAFSGDLKGTFNAAPLDVYAFNGSILQDIPTAVDDRYVYIKVISDNTVVHEAVYSKNGVYRMKAGFKGQVFEIEVKGNLELRYIKMAESVNELATL